MNDLRVLAALSDALGSDLGFPPQRLPRPRSTNSASGRCKGARSQGGRRTTRQDGMILASWRQLIDGSASNDGRPRSSRPPNQSLHGWTQGRGGSGQPGHHRDRGGWRKDARWSWRTMVDGTVWVPGNFGDAGLGELGVVAGQTVQVTGGAA